LIIEHARDGGRGGIYRWLYPREGGEGGRGEGVDNDNIRISFVNLLLLRKLNVEKSIKL
jgi:hypothetical protein